MGNVNLGTPSPSLSIEVISQIATRKFGVYVFVIGGEVVRVGETSKELGKRMEDYEKCVTHTLCYPFSVRRSGTPVWEAIGWWNRLSDHEPGRVYGKEGAIINSNIGAMNVYKAEEFSLIAQYDPPLNSLSERDRANRWRENIRARVGG